MRKNRAYLNSAAVIAIGAVLLGAGISVAKAQEDRVPNNKAGLSGQIFDDVRDAPVVNLSSSVPDVSLMTSTMLEKDPHILSRKAAAGAALAGLLAALLNLVGANNALRYIAGLGKSLAGGVGKVAIAAAKAPVKVAKAAAKVTTETLAGPGKWMLMLGGLAIFAFTGVAHFDLQWQAGMALGAGLTVAATYGFGKTMALTKSVTSSASHKLSLWTT